MSVALPGDSHRWFLLPAHWRSEVLISAAVLAGSTFKQISHCLKDVCSLILGVEAVLIRYLVSDFL